MTYLRVIKHMLSLLKNVREQHLRVLMLFNTYLGCMIYVRAEVIPFHIFMS